jgi:taurine dioxygenase
MGQLQIRNINDSFGAVVTGLDPLNDLGGETGRALRQLFDDRGALLFRELDIDSAHQNKLCRLLIGEEESGPVPDKVYHVSNKEPDAAAPYGRLMFHADMMWSPQPFQVLSLYATNVEPGSATTTLASGTCAWESLPADLRIRVQYLHAVHITGQVYGRGGNDLLRPQRENERSTVKKVAQRHPRTGKTILYVSQQNTREIFGFAPDESERLLQMLFSHLYRPENVYEHTWRTGDLLVFDNIAMQHGRGNVELNGPTRTLRKAIAPVPQIAAERPRFAKA